LTPFWAGDALSSSSQIKSWEKKGDIHLFRKKVDVTFSVFFVRSHGRWGAQPQAAEHSWRKWKRMMLTMAFDAVLGG